MGYIVYGRKQMKASALIAGIALCIYPYFLPGLPLNILVGLLIMAGPFLSTTETAQTESTLQGAV